MCHLLSALPLMAKPLHPLPRTITLPYGYVVKIRTVPAGECKEEDGKVLDGWWDEDTHTIFIKRTLGAARRRYILGHEFQHAALDWIHHCLNEGVMKA